MGPPMQSAAPMQSATYGNLPGMQMPPPSTPQMGMARPMGTMPMMGQQPVPGQRVRRPGAQDV